MELEAAQQMEGVVGPASNHSVGFEAGLRAPPTQTTTEQWTQALLALVGFSGRSSRSDCLEIHLAGLSEMRALV